MVYSKKNKGMPRSMTQKKERKKKRSSLDQKNGDKIKERGSQSK